jgi:hypothetical protein
MRDAEEMHGSDQLSAVPNVDRRARAGGVEEK